MKAYILTYFGMLGSEVVDACLTDACCCLVLLLFPPNKV